MSLIECISDLISHCIRNGYEIEEIIDKITSTNIKILTGDLADFVADSMGLDHIEVEQVIGCYLGNNAVSIVDEQTDTPEGVLLKPAVTGAKRCHFVITKGKKKGYECGTRIRGGASYCSKHKGRKSVL